MATAFNGSGYFEATFGDLPDVPTTIFGLESLSQTIPGMFVRGSTSILPSTDFDTIQFAHDSSGGNTYPIAPGTTVTFTAKATSAGWFHLQVLTAPTDGSQPVTLFTHLKNDFTTVGEYVVTGTFTMPATDIIFGIDGGTSSLEKIDYTLFVQSSPPPGARDDGFSGSPIVCYSGQTIIIDALANDVGTGLKIVPDNTFEDPTSFGFVHRTESDISYTAGNVGGEDFFTYRLSDGTTARVKVIVAAPTDGNDSFDSTQNNETVEGAGGLDQAVYAGPRASYVVSHVGTTITVRDTAAGRDGTDTLKNFERLVFSDGTLAFDTEGNAGEMYRLYQAAFDRTPDTLGLGYWIKGFDGGNYGDLAAVANNFLLSNEFKALYGTPATVTDDQFIGLLYANVLDRTPDSGGLTYWKDTMAHGLSRERVLASFSESAENKLKVSAAIQDGIFFT